MIAELKVFLIAMSPVLELRGSIPMALGIYHLPIWSAFLISILGNIVPVAVLLQLLKFVPENRLLSWLFERTRRKHTAKFEQWKEYALIILVAIPLPFTGAWTGSLCAFVFGIPFKKALMLISCGVIIAGLIVTLLYETISCC
ncbi:MAG: small multi-drug export protein [Candidatus Nealsonbacteria bacterium]